MSSTWRTNHTKHPRDPRAAVRFYPVAFDADATFILNALNSLTAHPQVNLLPLANETVIPNLLIHRRAHYLPPPVKSLPNINLASTTAGVPASSNTTSTPSTPQFSSLCSRIRRYNTGADASSAGLVNRANVSRMNSECVTTTHVSLGSNRMVSKKSVIRSSTSSLTSMSSRAVHH